MEKEVLSSRTNGSSDVNREVVAALDLKLVCPLVPCNLPNLKANVGENLGEGLDA